MILAMAASVRLTDVVAGLLAVAGAVLVVSPGLFSAMEFSLGVPDEQNGYGSPLGSMFTVAGGALVVAAAVVVGFDRFGTAAVRWTLGWTLGVCVFTLIFSGSQAGSSNSGGFGTAWGVGVAMGRWAAFAGVAAPLR
jgi:hypothetical protein